MIVGTRDQNVPRGDLRLFFDSLANKPNHVAVDGHQVGPYDAVDSPGRQPRVLGPFRQRIGQRARFPGRRRLDADRIGGLGERGGMARNRGTPCIRIESTGLSGVPFPKKAHLTT